MGGKPRLSGKGRGMGPDFQIFNDLIKLLLLFGFLFHLQEFGSKYFCSTQSGLVREGF